MLTHHWHVNRLRISGGVFHFTVRSNDAFALLFSSLLPPRLANHRSTSTSAASSLVSESDARSPQAEVDEDPIAAGATGDVLRGKWRGKEIAIKVLQVRERTLSKAETDGVIKSFSREVSRPSVQTRGRIQAPCLLAAGAVIKFTSTRFADL